MSHIKIYSTINMLFLVLVFVELWGRQMLRRKRFLWDGMKTGAHKNIKRW